jgi:hypothetical protein
VCFVLPNGDYHYAQVTELVPEKERGKVDQNALDKMREVSGMYDAVYTHDPNDHHNFGKYWVDFGKHSFVSDDLNQLTIYARKLKERLVTEMGWGSNPKAYQAVEEIGLEGQRDMNKRVQQLRLGEIDFSGKTVIDYGCSGGSMCRYALDRGAKYVVGLDTPTVSNAAYELSNYLGYFNIDFMGGNFRHDPGNSVYDQIKERSLPRFDIVLYLSCQQLLMPDYLPEICGEMFILEGHSGDHEETYRPTLEKYFPVVNYIGASNDHSIRPVFICEYE